MVPISPCGPGSPASPLVPCNQKEIIYMINSFPQSDIESKQLLKTDLRQMQETHIYTRGT